MMRRLMLIVALMWGYIQIASGEEEPPQPVEETSIPQIVLHDILTNRVCIFESKLYSIGAKVIILGKPHECTNANPMTFGAGDADWDMRWVPVTKEKA